MKRVKSYCRVSTDHRDQANSLESQKGFFQGYVDRNLQWQYLGMYYDEETGTNTKNRKGFNKMIEDAEAGLFDMLITKEVSRFARNTLDTLEYTRKLKKLGVGVIFLNDNIDTLENDGELRLTIMSSIAQEESRKTSDRVKWGQARMMEKGVVFGTNVYGYYLKKGKLSVNEDEAETVRLIYSLYLNEGLGCNLIARELEQRGIPSPAGNKNWDSLTVLRMIKNEKYCGDLKQRKKYTEDHLSHKRIKNYGEVDFITVENNHEPLVSRELFDETQREIERRRTITYDKSRHSNKYVWSGRVKCAHCDKNFRRTVWNPKTNPQVMWQCSENKRAGTEKINGHNQKIGCNSKAVKEEILSDVVLKALNEVKLNKNKIIEELGQDIGKVLMNTKDKSDIIKEINAKIDKLNTRKNRLIDLFTDGVITRKDYDEKNNNYNSQLEALSEELEAIKAEENHVDNIRQRLSVINDTVETIVSFDVFSEGVCKEVLNKLVVHSREKIDVYLVGENKVPPLFIPLSLHPWDSSP